MARTFIREEYPTLSSVVRDIREGSTFRDVTREEVVAVAKQRGVPLKEGRVRKRYVSDIYFGIRQLRGEN